VSEGRVGGFGMRVALKWHGEVSKLRQKRKVHGKLQKRKRHGIYNH